MTEVNTLLFWSICTLAALGIVRAAIDIFRPPKEPARSPFERPSAPQGHTWVLIADSQLNRVAGSLRDEPGAQEAQQVPDWAVPPHSQ